MGDEDGEQIMAADVVPDGILVYFRGGRVALFPHEALYIASSKATLRDRNEDGIRVVESL
jgi:hypothetical protein